MREYQLLKIERFCEGGVEIGKHICVVQTARLRIFQVKQACTHLLCELMSNIHSPTKETPKINELPIKYLYLLFK